MTGHIEKGWRSYLEMVVPRAAGPAQVAETRMAFFAGAMHLYATLMTDLDPGDEITERDLAKMQAIHDELAAFDPAPEPRVQPEGGPGQAQG